MRLSPTTETSVLDKGSQTGNFDVAAGIHETSVQSFLGAHYTKNRAMYSGEGEFSDLGITYTWDVPQPPNVTLAPIPSSDSKRYAEQNVAFLMQANPRLARERALKALEDNPPNIKVHCPEIDCTIKFDTDSISVKTNFTMLGDIELSENTVKIVVTSAYIGDIQSFTEQLAKAIRENERLKSDPGSWEKLLKHVINTLLKNNLPKVIESINLPNAITVVTGLDLGSFGVEVANKHIVVTAKVVHAVNKSFDFTSEVFSEREESQNEERAAKLVGKVLRPLDSEFFVLIGNRVFQTIGKVYLERSFNGRVDESSGNWKYSFDWVVNLANAAIQVQNAGLHGQIDASGDISNGSLWWKKIIHCTFKGTAKVPGHVSVSAPLSVSSSNTVYMDAKVASFRPTVNISFGGWCSIADYPVSKIAEDKIEQYTKDHPITRHQQLIAVPSQFPATNLIAKIDLKSIDNVAGDLAFSGDLKFTP